MDFFRTTAPYKSFGEGWLRVWLMLATLWCLLTIVGIALYDLDFTVRHFFTGILGHENQSKEALFLIPIDTRSVIQKISDSLLMMLWRAAIVVITPVAIPYFSYWLRCLGKWVAIGFATNKDTEN